MLSLKYIALALLPLTLGRVTNLFAPQTAKAGQNFTADLTFESYIQNWDDFGVSRHGIFIHHDRVEADHRPARSSGVFDLKT